MLKLVSLLGLSVPNCSNLILLLELRERLSLFKPVHHSILIFVFGSKCAFPPLIKLNMRSDLVLFVSPCLHYPLKKALFLVELIDL